jgi:hypothetical protein
MQKKKKKDYTYLMKDIYKYGFCYENIEKILTYLNYSNV